MTHPRKPGFVLPIAVALAVLLGLYVGAYYAAAEPVTQGAHGTSIAPFYAESRHVRYVLERLFAPIHWLDRRIRPHVWEPKP